MEGRERRCTRVGRGWWVRARGQRESHAPEARTRTTKSMAHAHTPHAHPRTQGEGKKGQKQTNAKSNPGKRTFASPLLRSVRSHANRDNVEDGSPDTFFLCVRVVNVYVNPPCVSAFPCSLSQTQSILLPRHNFELTIQKYAPLSLRPAFVPPSPSIAVVLHVHVHPLPQTLPHLSLSFFAHPHPPRRSVRASAAWTSAAATTARCQCPPQQQQQQRAWRGRDPPPCACSWRG